jgi:hypothetical protein
MRYQTALRSDVPAFYDAWLRRRTARYTAPMVRRVFLAAATLLLPLAALLFAQWPLREVVQAFSRQANDAAQVLFALAMAFGVTHASRTGTHLVAGHAPRSARFLAAGTAACVLPWAIFTLANATGPVWESIRTLERFPETLTPGYFLIRVALWLLVAMVLLQALAACWHAWRAHA